MRFVLARRSEAGSPLDRHLQGKGPVPFTQKLRRTSPILGGYSTVQDTSLWLTRRWPLWAFKTCLLNGYFGRVYLPLAVPRFRFTYVSLDLLSRSPPYSRPFLVLPRTARCCWTGKGGFGREVGSPSPQRSLHNLSSLSSPTSLCLFVCLFVSVCLGGSVRLFRSPSRQGDSGPNDSGSPLSSRHFISLPSRHVDPSFLGPTWWLQFPGTTSVEDMCHRSP